jgi:hypothetical protein
MALKPDEIIEVLRENGIPQDKIAAVFKDLAEIEEAKKEEREASKGPKQKSKFIAFVMDDGTLAGKTLLAYILQVPQDMTEQVALSNFYDSCRDYNNTARKAKKFPIKTVGDGMQTVKGKFTKDRKIKIKTKESITPLVVVNDIPDPTKRVSDN